MPVRPPNRRGCPLVAAIVLASAAAVPLAAQSYTSTGAWRWVRYAAADGLPSDHVTAVAVAGGRVWAGTAAGPAWFDGFRWHGVPGGPRERVEAVAGWHGDSVLALVNGDLYLGDTAGWTRLTLPGIRAGAVVAALPVGGGVLVLADGRLWMVTGGAARPLPGPFAPGEWVELVRPARGGGAWVTTTRAVYRWDESRWTVRMRPRAGGWSITDLAEEPGGAVLFYQRLPDLRRGLWTWQAAGAPRLERRESRSQLVAMAAGADGEFATASGYEDIRLGRPGAWHTLQLPVDAASPQALAFTAGGDLWIGTESGLLLYRRSATRWTYWLHERDDLRNEVSDILRARDGAIWIATANGIEVHDSNGSERWITHAAGRAVGAVTALAQDSEGNIWVGSGSNPIGALRFDGRGWRRFGSREGLGAPRVHRIVADRRGRLWFLGLGELDPGESSGRGEPGAYLLDRGAFTPFGITQGLPGGRVYGFAETSDSALLFATGSGLSRLRRGGWTHWTRANGLRSDRVFAVAVDSGGRVWFAHQSGGLGYLDDADQPRYLTEADGLVSDQVWSLAADADRSLWIGTWAGLSRYRDGEWTTIGIGDGLTNLHVWPVVPVGDRVYLGTQGGGTNVLDVRDLASAAPLVVPEQPDVQSDRVVLRWRAYALEGRVPATRILTRWRLDAGPWSRWTSDREAVLGRPSAGGHVVTFAAADYLGAAAPASRIAFRVLRPVYQRPAVFVPFGLLLGLLAAGGWQARRLRGREAARRRLLEEQLRQSQKLEAVGQLTSGIAHDLNNVLGVVLAGMQTVRHALPDVSSEAREGMLDVERAAQRGAAMIRKLLGFGRRSELIVETTDLGTLLEALVPVVQRLLPASIEIVPTVERPLAPVLADPGAVEQILWNVATNARDAMPDGGTLRLRVSGVTWAPGKTSSRWMRPGRYVVLVVEDDGPGMPAETLSRVFEPFFTTKPVGSGTGLGMAMVYGLMKQHDGFVAVDSAPGRGTRVTLYFPEAQVAAGEARAPSVVSGEQLAHGTETILVVEDEAALRQAAVRILRRLGYRVLEAADGAAGMELFTEHRDAIDLVLSDLIMPSMGGRAMYDAMREQAAGTKILFTTGYGIQDVADLDGLGVEIEVLRKPWTIGELAAAVRRALDR